MSDMRGEGGGEVCEGRGRRGGVCVRGEGGWEVCEWGERRGGV